VPRLLRHEAAQLTGIDLEVPRRDVVVDLLDRLEMLQRLRPRWGPVLAAVRPLRARKAGRGSSRPRCGWRSRAWSGYRRPQPRSKLPAGSLVLVHDLGWRRRARCVANRRAPPRWWRDLRSRTVGAGAQYAGLITQGFWGSWPTKTY
jgi:hypothetical protein